MSSALAAEVSDPHANLSGWKPALREDEFGTTGSRALPILPIHCRDRGSDVRAQPGFRRSAKAGASERLAEVLAIHFDDPAHFVEPGTHALSDAVA